MSSTSTKTLLCTANVGTVFENLDEMMNPYINELLTKVTDSKPEFVAIHMQEVGGKHYKQTMQSIDTFFKCFLSNEMLSEYDRYLILIDSDFSDDFTFTSLSNIYLIHNSLTENDVEIYNFNEKVFYKFLTRQIYTGNLTGNDFIFKERFEKKFFPEFNWSRKGFVQTKWRIRNNTLNLVNVHLFHDASNLVALSVSPSIYSENRKKALKYTVDRINSTKCESEINNYNVIFGDFNFRLDLGPMIEKYTLKCKSNGIKSEDSTQKTFKDVNEKEIFVIADKKFKWNYCKDIQAEINNLIEFDKELSTSEEPLYECSRNFPPSYPFMEDLVNFNKYMETRCPAWCDRIIFNSDFNDIINDQENVIYDMMGKGVPMGDHKPIYLVFDFKSQKFLDTVNEQSNEPITNIDSNNNNDYKLKNNLDTNILNDSNNIHKTNSNYVFINLNLVNLTNSVIDLHDNAWFTHTYPLIFLKDKITYADYTIFNLPPENNQNITSATQKSIFDYHSQIFEQTDITLNQWIRSIGELVIYFHKNSLNSEIENNGINSSSTTSNNNNNHVNNICYKMNPNEKSSVNNKQDKDCQCISKLVNLSRSYLVNFFLNSLNANFFKLKHLLAYLNDQIILLSVELQTKKEHVNTSTTNPTTTSTTTNINDDIRINVNNNELSNGTNGQLLFHKEDLKNSLDNSHKTLAILNETYAFLNSTCTHNLFKNALKKSNSDKKLSIYFNFYTNRNFNGQKSVGQMKRIKSGLV